ncbi:MAG: NFACT family protein, partial [Thermoplasmata archaeon]|nr:NFACT family protein [Thermoplasmata archaeon]
MKKDLGSFDLLVLAMEYQDLLGAYVDNLYQPGKGEFMVRLNSKEKGKRFLRVKVGKWIWLEEECSERNQSGFSNSVKKHISNGRIKAVEQLGFERIIKFTIQKKDEYELVVEFIPPGNVILVKDGVIVRAYSERKWKDRIVKTGEPYKPPIPRLDVPALKKKEFLSALKGSEKDLVRALARDLNLGGVYAEEVCLRAGLDKKKKADGLGEKELEKAYKGFQALIGDFESKISPVVILEKGKPLDVVPIRLMKYEARDTKEFGSFNEALTAFLSEVGEEEAVPKDPEKERVSRVVRSQKEAVEKWESVIEKSQGIAEQIYLNFG